MASRRLLDPSQHVSTKRTASYAYLQFKTLLLSLALVSCMISIKCASYGHRLTTQQLHRQPEYHLYSRDEPSDEIFSFGSAIDQPLRQQDVGGQSSIDYLASALDEPSSRYYYSPQASRYPSHDRVESVYRQLARNLRDDQSPLLVPSAPSSDISLPDTSNDAGEGFVGEFDIEGTGKLVDLLRSRYSNRLLNFEDGSKIATDPKALFSSPASDQSSELGQADDDSPLLDRNGQRQVADKVDEDRLSSSADSESQTSGSSYDKRNEESRNFTTLLESDENPNTRTDGNATDTKTDQAKSTDDTSYGTVLKSAASLDKQDSDNKTTKPASTSLFSRMYRNLAKYLPFMNQIDILNGNDHKSEDGSANGADGKRVAVSNENVDEKETKFASTNQRVSTPKSDGPNSTGGILSSGSISEAVNSKDNTNDNDKVDRKELPANTKTESENMSSSFASSKRIELSNGKQNSDSVENDTNKQVGSPGTTDAHEGEHRVHLVRQSSLVMPYNPSHDELVSVNHPSGSLIGKYIYAPLHRYLTSPSGNVQDPKALDLDDELYAHRSYSRRLQPEMYNTYSGLRPMYASQAMSPEGSSMGLVGNKSNDVYFLVMVAAFCAMAMTVVFAAGLFAYRIQQSRKASSETDYPTYGVVGPNNMNGKGSAASFVGGYFGNIGHGSISSGSKNGSTKHLPDTHSQSDSGVASSGKSVGKRASNEHSSTASSRLDFMANQNAARMYLYQHQKQQMIISDSASNGRHTSASDLDSEDENDDGSYTVYECPGLASAHEMEIKNPLFNDDRTP